MLCVWDHQGCGQGQEGAPRHFRDGGKTGCSSASFAGLEVLGFSREVASGLECWCIEAWEGLGLSFPSQKPATSSGSLDGESRMQAVEQELFSERKRATAFIITVSTLQAGTMRLVESGRGWS